MCITESHRSETFFTKTDRPRDQEVRVSEYTFIVRNMRRIYGPAVEKIAFQEGFCFVIYMD